MQSSYLYFASANVVFWSCYLGTMTWSLQYKTTKHRTSKMTVQCHSDNKAKVVETRGPQCLVAWCLPLNPR